MEIYEDLYSQDKKSRYKVLKRIGEGSFGEVVSATDTFHGCTVAVKNVRILSQKEGLPRAVFRELQSLKLLSESPFIVKVLDVYTDQNHLCLVMEMLSSDVGELINSSPSFFPRYQLKCYFNMMLQAVEFCHSRKIIHRDIKPTNILISDGGIFKLGDFGLARICEPDNEKSLSHQVSTRQYRAPELLFAYRHYNQAVDIWSIAVVMMELITLQTLFPGLNDIDQMHKVFQIMGSPTPDRWKDVEKLPDYCKVNFPDMEPLNLSLIAPHAHPEDLDFISNFLQLDPGKRATAREGLKLPYLSTNPLPGDPSSFHVPSRATSNNSTSKKDKIESLEDFDQRILHLFSF